MNENDIELVRQLCDLNREGLLEEALLRVADANKCHNEQCNKREFEYLVRQLAPAVAQVIDKPLPHATRIVQSAIATNTREHRGRAAVAAFHAGVFGTAAKPKGPRKW